MNPHASDPRSDHDLVEAVNRGDRAAFDVLYYRHRDWVMRLATRMTGDDADALDVLQETFVYLAGRFPGLVLRAKLTTLLYPVVKNLSIAVRRRRLDGTGNEQQLLTTPSAPAAPAAADLSDLAVVLSILPETQRETLLLRFVDGMSLEEIAAAMHVPPGTVKSRLHTALATLRADPRTAAYFQRHAEGASKPGQIPAEPSIQARPRPPD